MGINYNRRSAMKKVILLFITGVITFTSASASRPFVDVSEEAWYFQWVNTIQELKLTTGYSDHTFKPDHMIKRIEFLSLTMKSLGYDIPVSKGYWGQNILDKAVELNIISRQRIDLSTSDPEGSITRQESARIVYNAYKKNNDQFKSDAFKQVKEMISDYGDIHTLYQEGVLGVITSGIVEGYENNLFKPRSYLSRAEAAVMISRLVLPEKRKPIVLEGLSYSYTSRSRKATNFTVYYQAKDQDVINILTIADYIENMDPLHGFASLVKVSGDKGYKVEFYTSLDDYDFNSGSNLDKHKNWTIQLQRESNQTKEDMIHIISWRKSSEGVHKTTVKAIFNYLFAEDADRMWQLYFELANKPLTTGLSIGNKSESFGRTFIITADEEKVSMGVGRKDNVLPVEIKNGKLMVHFSSLLSDGTLATVTLEDVRDNEST